MHIDKPMHDLTFNVAQLLREETGARRNYVFAENELSLDAETALRDISGSVQFTRTASGVLANVKLRGIVELACIRCLTPSIQEVVIAFQDEFHSQVEVTTGFALPKPDEEDPFFIDETHKLDLGEAIREYALLNLPMRPLCRPDCKGLCPTCGADRNAGDCGCVVEDSDERFAALRGLLNQEPDTDQSKG